MLRSRSNRRLLGLRLPGGEVFQAHDFWAGVHAKMPAGGELLVAEPGQPQPSTPVPGGYVWVTPGYSYISCLPGAANDGGDGFLAITPEGTKYRFTHKAEFYETQVARPMDSNSTLQGQLNRRRVVLYATEVRDRFNNTVTYTYANGPRQRGRLTSIVASDGRSLSFTYNLDGFISTISEGLRVWTYRYTTTPGRRYLDEVEQPDGALWTFQLKDLIDADLSYGVEGPALCDGFPIVKGIRLPASATPEPSVTGTMTHPSGAVGTFVVNYGYQSRTNVPRVCLAYRDGLGNVLEEFPLWPRTAVVLRVKQKNLSGPSLPAMQWDDAFGSGIGSFNTTGCFAAACAGTATAEILGPEFLDVSGETHREYHNYTFGNSYQYNEDKQLRLERGSYFASTPIVLEDTIMAYQLPTQSPPTTLRIGRSLRERGDGFASEHPRPQTVNNLFRDGTLFSSTASGFDPFFYRPSQVLRLSKHGFSRTETLEYQDLLNLWVVGLPTRTLVDGVEASRTEYDANGLPQHSYRFGRRDRTYTYHLSGEQAGRVHTIADGVGSITTLTDWHRGIPRNIEFADSKVRSATVNNFGWITSITDEENDSTSHSYDSMGRITSTTYPQDPGSAYAPTTRTFAPIAGSEFGLPIGSWKQTIATGNYRKHIWFDGLWRPLLEREWDSTDEATTARLTARGYDARGELRFESYAQTTAANYAAFTQGRRSLYDGLRRLRRTQADSELGAITHTWNYLSPFVLEEINGNGNVTRSRFQAFDTPGTEHPIEVIRGFGAPAAEQSTTSTERDVYGKPMRIIRSGNGHSAQRRYLYDTEQRLCQLTEPESRALVMQYDGASRMVWSAEGRAEQPTCLLARDVPNAERIFRAYNKRGRLIDVNYPEVSGLPSPDVTFSYTGDGLQHTVQSAGGNWTYTYTSLRQPKTEQLSTAFATFSIAHDYDQHGARSALTYPNGESYAFNPNALGQPRQHGALLSDATYHANGEAHRWRYGNGARRTLQQNLRRLPQRILDERMSGSSVVGSLRDESYSFDANGNLTNIGDLVDTANSRTLGYDAQDRLTQANGHWGPGTLTYDGADNLRTQFLGTGIVKRYSYTYDQEKLQSISNNCTPLIGFAYDARGNQTQKSGQQFLFDRANRLVEVRQGNAAIARYEYDGRGRRTTMTYANGDRVRTMYAQSGQMLYEQRSFAPQAESIFGNGFEAGSGVSQGGSTGAFASSYHYHGNTLIARRDTQSLTPLVQQNTFLHTDLLGTVIAESDAAQAVVKRYRYEPFGSLDANLSGPGFTGHRHDSETELVYMQGRYYDGDIGRFLSMDPAPPQSDGSDFNRYAYARNNPYRYTDPNGRVVDTPWDVFNIGVGLVSFGTNVMAGNVAGAAVDAVGVIADTAAAIVPGIPGGVATTIATARAADKVVDVASSANKLDKAADPVLVTVSAEKYPEAAKHIADAQAAGKPDVLTIKRDGAASNRKESLAGIKTESGKDRDEYPPAMFEEGGKGASVRLIDSSDNRGAGACVGAQCRNLPDDAKVRIVVEDKKNL